MGRAVAKGIDLPLAAATLYWLPAASHSGIGNPGFKPALSFEVFHNLIGIKLIGPMPDLDEARAFFRP